jgi:hypothetical protein
MSVKSKVRNATRAVAKAFTPTPDNSADVDILDTLKKERDEVKALWQPASQSRHSPDHIFVLRISRVFCRS